MSADPFLKWWTSVPVPVRISKLRYAQDREVHPLIREAFEAGRKSAAQPAEEVQSAAANVHQVTLKTRKEMNRTIPRDRLGWWYDVCPGQHMTLRDATAADLARCSLKDRPAHTPEDYLCELPENGSLIHRHAIKHCRTFAITASKGKP